MGIPAPIVVFVRPQAAGNIGALARVMSNFCPSALRLVGSHPGIGRDPEDPFLTMDWALAKKGEGILKTSQWFEDLGSALHDTQLAIGSSGRSTEFELGYARPLVTPESAFESVESAFVKSQKSPDFRWALVLGPEDDGLNEKESSLCQKLIRIPTADSNPSLNIAVAAAVVLYDLWRFQNGARRTGHDSSVGAFLGPERTQAKLRSSEKDREQWASFEHCERFVDYVMESVSMTSFLKYPDQDAVRARIRRWVQAGPIPLGELLFAFELLYHFRAWGSGRFEERDFLKAKEKSK
jgi:TrmH family RNA methyltransferase